MTDLEFEKPIVELKNKIAELRQFMQQSGIDLSDEVAKLEGRLSELSEQLYANLTPWQRVLIARHPNRPTTLDYIQGICESFME
ncbi:MAG: acetyl-CoA carboxylase carboxyl transferase subunit alpha, partial [Alicyclobacillus sp.]|nr:acetyl-CoA carboxylase carboxyl transferase subunit alpha [Alicyclobacillus sp.]